VERDDHGCLPSRSSVDAPVDCRRRRTRDPRASQPRS
jgi:hypothetical protein